MSTILYRSLKYLFHPNLRCKLQEKIASCDSAFSESCNDIDSFVAALSVSNVMHYSGCEAETGNEARDCKDGISAEIHV